MYVFMYVIVYARVCECIGMCMYVWCMFVCVYIMRAWLRGTAIQTRLVRSGPVAEDSELCSLWTRYTGDSKTDP